MHFPVPTVRLIVSNADGRVLLLRRASSDYGTGSWCLPGGKVDYGNTLEETVATELREETGLVCDSATFLFPQDSLPLEPGKMHCINLYFECRASGEFHLNDESSEAAWVRQEEIEQYEIVFGNDEGLRRYWAEAGSYR